MGLKLGYAMVVESVHLKVDVTHSGQYNNHAQGIPQSIQTSYFFMPVIF